MDIQPHPALCRLSNLRVVLFCCLLVVAFHAPALSRTHARQISEGTEDESLLSQVRQVTFEGKRAGEGYFSHDGSQLVFQSERDPSNPFYQIYRMDLQTGETVRVSPGYGKTTCGWIHPDGRVLYASTHLDPDARKKQQEELDFRESGKSRRYQWDYDEHFDLFLGRPGQSDPLRLTTERGYDAEASISPDGEWIVLSSNRHAYDRELTPRQKELFVLDKSFMLDLYLMRADGSDVRRLTQAPGYDGGPFFGPDGKTICFRRFSEDGSKAEIFTTAVDGSGETRLTSLEAMSWAPFFHPSGAYLIFTTNLHGFGNFELYLVDAAGLSEPVRVTRKDGFDGLPVFSPDGTRLAWTSSRTADGSSQIFFADWDHTGALGLLREARQAPSEESAGSVPAAPPVEPSVVAALEPSIAAQDVRAHVERLASEPMQGRGTGTQGARLASAYVADVLAGVGLKPAGAGGSFFQEFQFTAGVVLGRENRLSGPGWEETFELDQDWRPLSFSSNGTFQGEVVFAGYGIVAPEAQGQPEYDSYAHLDVKDKWVLCFRYLPENITAKRRQHLGRYASLRYKTMAARDRGAIGILIVSGPHSQVKQELVRLGVDASLSGSGIAALSISDSLGSGLVTAADRDLAGLQAGLDEGELQMGFPIPGRVVIATVEIIQEKRTGRNVLARLEAASPPAPGGDLVIGAHLDHLGLGLGGNSLARGEEQGQVHYGADDNASGVAALLEIAQSLVDLKDRGQFLPRRDVIFGAWSGEELGLLGSSHYVASRGASGDEAASSSLSGRVSAYLNMDMVGRLRDAVSLQGVGSSSIWPSEIERRNVPVGLPIVTSQDSYLPTDATAFYLRGVPILSAFTGAHSDYHTPRDTSDKIDYRGTEKIARLFALIARSLATRETPPDYQEQTRPESGDNVRGLRVYLGTIPDYVQGDVKGLALSGVTSGGPAEQAGVQSGDVIVELAGRRIENIYDYTYAIDDLKIGQASPLVVIRNGERLSLTIVPGSRQ